MVQNFSNYFYMKKGKYSHQGINSRSKAGQAAGAIACTMPPPHCCL